MNRDLADVNARTRLDRAGRATCRTKAATCRKRIPVRLFVDPPHRQRGAGKLLMLAANTYATEHGLTLVFDVMLKDQDAIRLYEAFGCQRLGTIDHHHSDGKTEPAAVYVVPSDA